METDPNSADSTPLGVSLALGAVALLVVVIIVQTVLSAVFQIVKIGLILLVLAGVAAAILRSKD